MKRFFAFASLLIAGCAHQAPPSITPYQAELARAFDDISAGERAPASAPAGVNLGALNKVSPGKFKVYVFPKINSDTQKSNAESAPIHKDARLEQLSELGVPLEYEVSPIAVASCEQFIAKDLFAKHSPKDYFAPELAQDKSRQCAIVEIVSVNLRSANHALIRRDDQLRVRLYLDDQYRLHGTETDIYENGHNLRTARMKSTGKKPASSGLSQFPIDIPSFETLGHEGVKHGRIETMRRLDKLAVRQIQRKYQREFQPVACDGVEARYKDYYGGKIEAGWCDGLPFPQYMDNSRFLAITQKLEVR